MHAITVPEDVILLDPVTDEPIKDLKPASFKEFVLSVILSDQRWRADLEMIEKALKIRKAVKVLGKPGDELKLEDADFKSLKECAEKPSNGSYSTPLPTQFLPQLYPLLAAIKDAKKE